MVDAGLRPSRRRPLGGFRPIAAARAVVGSSLWRDPIAVGLIVASIVGLSALAIYVHAWLPSLPRLLPLHYNGQGSVDLIGPRSDLYKMPGIGAVVFISDLVVSGVLHRRERLAALILLAASALVQVMLIVATINVIRLAFGD
ncbi:MAG TPA: hypothetical protein VNL16_02745 [Chloroflexota bacterium]|nr:hypothetical protein [Chloroflexota bacterium]